MQPAIGIILGTGLGDLAKEIKPEVVVDYGDIPHFPISTVESHHGKLIFGTDARDANIKALTYMTDFATKHKVMPEGIASYNTEDAHTVFLQGRAAFGFGTGGLIGQCEWGKDNPRENVESVFRAWLEPID
jgi:hypothetical protein